MRRFDEFGVGSGSVRTIAGTMSIHMELERRLAAFKKTEAVVVFQSGFAANAGTVSALLNKDDVIISDELNHASIIDGCRLSRAAIKVFPHKDVDGRAQDPAGAAGIAAQAAHHRRRVQHGRRPRRAARALRAGRGVRLHHDGGRRARAAACSAKTAAARSIISTCTAGWTFRSARCRRRWARSAATWPGRTRSSSSCTTARGRFCSRRRIRRRSRPPASRRSTCSSSEPEIIERLWDEHAVLQGRASRRSGFNTGLSESPITPVIAGEGSRAMKLSDRLFEEGVFAQGIAFPTVARDKARVRTIVTATHTRDELAVRAGQVQEGRARTRTDLDASDSMRPAPRAHVLRRVHARPDAGGLPAAVHARHGRGLPLSSPRHDRSRPKLAAEPWYRRWLIHARLLFIAFTMRLSPARRVLYGVGAGRRAPRHDAAVPRLRAARACCCFRSRSRCSLPHWVDGTMLAARRRSWR